MLPRGCDAVVPVEQVQRNGAIARSGASRCCLQNVHRRGSDCSQGALLLAAGTRLSAPEVAIAAGAGMARLRSAPNHDRRDSTGNELIEPGEVIDPPGAPLECLRHHRRAAAAWIRARRRRSRAR
jgi:molybdopterin molybdotransferase